MLAWQLVRGKPIWEFRDLRDSRRHCLRKIEKVVKDRGLNNFRNLVPKLEFGNEIAGQLI